MGKECCSNVSSRLWGGALRDETKNGCDGDYIFDNVGSDLKDTPNARRPATRAYGIS